MSSASQSKGRQDQMSNRKHTTTTGVATDSATAQENLNVLYTAHQVHTMAQFVYRHLSGAWRGQTPWAPNAAAGFPATTFGTSPNMSGFTLPGGAMPGAMQGAVPTFHAAPPALFYWYP